MAYGGGYDETIYSSLSGNGFTSSCLAGVPYKIGPKFKPPIKVILPPDIDLRMQSRSSALNAEYSFDVEEAVLKWSAEREKQKEERLELQRQATLRRSQESSSPDSNNDHEETGATAPSANDPQPLYENVPQALPKPKPRQKQQGNVYANVTIPNPFIGSISNDILLPTPIQSNTKETEETSGADQNSSTNTNIDLTWFERQDDPFDNMELKTINDMEELASVLQQTTTNTPREDENQAQEGDTETKVVIDTKDSANEDDEEDNTYENVNLVMIKNGPINGASASNSSLLDLTKLPPVPPRRDLVGRLSPLPPIGQTPEPGTSRSINQQAVTETGVSNGLCEATPSVLVTGNDDSNLYDNSTTSSSFLPTDSVSKPISHKAPVKKPPRTFKYSRNVESDTDINGGNSEPNNGYVKLNTHPISTSVSDGNFSVQFTKTQSSSNLSEVSDEVSLTFDSNHFGESANCRPVPTQRKTISPPPRPSSAQSWNRYNPLPSTLSTSSTSPQPATVALPVISPDSVRYSELRKEAQTSVDNLTAMGFPRDRVVRAVERLGEDEKEIVEFLCLVDQLTEKGYSLPMAETSLSIFKNSMNKASAFLELFTQFQELGFSGEKIKEALVNTNNDREKTLDILTAS